MDLDGAPGAESATQEDMAVDVPVTPRAAGEEVVHGEYLFLLFSASETHSLGRARRGADGSGRHYKGRTPGADGCGRFAKVTQLRADGCGR